MTKRLAAKVGTYEKGGETKGRYVDVGAILTNDKGEYILLSPSVSLSGILAMQNAMSSQPRTNVMISVFDSDYQGNQNTQPAPSQPASQQPGGQDDSFDPDLPF